MNANVLIDPCIRVRLLDGRTELLSLPGVMAALERNEVESFPALRAHQAHPWHAFLCQLAAMALEGDKLPPVDPARPETFLGGLSGESWRGKIRALTPEFPQDEPWTLVVEDLSKPAFMQPPYSGCKKGGKTYWSPDDLDVLFASKCHGLKPWMVQQAQADQWIFALVSLQTHAPYGGPKLYGSTRQNSGNGSRSCVRLASGILLGTRFIRDTRVMLDNPEAYDSSGVQFTAAGGQRLIWVLPWDGKTSLSLDKLHSLFIECSRIVRLSLTKGAFMATYQPTNCLRLAGKEYKGNVGDPWIPIERKDSKAFNTRPRYESMSKVMFDPQLYQASLTQNSYPSDPKDGLAMEFSILIRGNCVTEGLENRRVPLPAKSSTFPFVAKDKAAEMSRSMVALAKNAENKVLWPSVTLLMQAGRKDADRKQKETSAWARRIVDEMDRVVDERFFSYLWECLERWSVDPDSINAALEPWKNFLRDEAEKHFERAAQSLPSSSAMRIAARAKAEGLFAATARKQILTTQQEGEHRGKGRARSRKAK